jgi:hypothetical protein
MAAEGGLTDPITFAAMAQAFVDDCRAAKLTVREDWVAPADTTVLQAIFDKHLNFMRQLATSRIKINTRHVCKPLVWHIFRSAVFFVPSVELT